MMLEERRARVGWLLALVLAAGPAIGQQAEVPTSAAESTRVPTWYAQAMAHGDAGLNVTNFWSRGAKMRAETVIAGHKIVTIVNDDYYYAYDALDSKGVAIRRTKTAIAADSPGRRPFGREHESLLQQGAEKVDERSFQGTTAEIYRITNTAGRREVWVNKIGSRLPVRVIIYQRATGRTQTTEYLNWLSNMPIEDSFFQPEASVELERFGFYEYMEQSALKGPVGTVPVLYADLLHGNRPESP